MDKLPCPFCGGEAAMKEWDGFGRYVRCSVCKACGAVKPTDEEATAAWNRRAQPENKPLTLDELNSISEPTRLWIVDLWGDIEPHYELVQWEVIKACPLEKMLHCISLDGHDDFILWYDYGDTWLAYCHKPKEEHHEAD